MFPCGQKELHPMQHDFDGLSPDASMVYKGKSNSSETKWKIERMLQAGVAKWGKEAENPYQSEQTISVEHKVVCRGLLVPNNGVHPPDLQIDMPLSSDSCKVGLHVELRWRIE